jgi:fructose-1,6-bisphosphatase/inositol monophosphatase family enzyme
MLKDIEKEAISSFRCNEADSGLTDQHDRDAWLKFGIRFLLDTGRVVRGLRYGPLSDVAEFKADGSPFLPGERQIEATLRQHLARFAPGAGVVGEESGGDMRSTGVVVAIDPVDGTWSLLNRCETHTTSLAFFEDGKLFLGMILNSVTGELAYSMEKGPSRLLQLNLFGEHDDAFDMPLNAPSPGKPLVNIHPARTAGALVEQLFEKWGQDQIAMVKASGGSPSWALLEAAKGVFTYVNLWAGKPADPFDLAGGISLVRGAGGEVLGPDEAPVPLCGHQGPFVAGVDRKKLATVVSALWGSGK